MNTRYYKVLLSETFVSQNLFLWRFVMSVAIIILSCVDYLTTVFERTKNEVDALWEISLRVSRHFSIGTNPKFIQ